jgi:hypothetical protein
MWIRIIFGEVYRNFINNIYILHKNLNNITQPNMLTDVPSVLLSNFYWDIR